MLGLDDPYSAGAVEADWWAPPLGRPETLREVATHLKQGRTPYGQKSARGGRWQRAFAVKWLSQYKGFVAGWVCDAFGRLDVFKSRALYANPVAQALEYQCAWNAAMLQSEDLPKSFVASLNKETAQYAKL